MISEHDRLVGLAQEAIAHLLADKTIEPETMRDSLVELRGEVDLRLDAIERDLDKEYE